MEQPRIPKLVQRYNRQGLNTGSGILLIGLELRLQDYQGMQEELMIVPLDYEIPTFTSYNYAWRFGNHTLHTSVGDVNIPAVELPVYGF